jgi:hypothetical protein
VIRLLLVIALSTLPCIAAQQPPLKVSATLTDQIVCNPRGLTVEVKVRINNPSVSEQTVGTIQILRDRVYASTSSRRHASVIRTNPAPDVFSDQPVVETIGVDSKQPEVSAITPGGVKEIVAKHFVFLTTSDVQVEKSSGSRVLVGFAVVGLGQSREYWTEPIWIPVPRGCEISNMK